MILLNQIEEFIKSLTPAAIFLAVLYVAYWIRKIFKQKGTNAINEIDLLNKKISLDNNSKPIGELVSDANTKHGADEMVRPTGNDDKKRNES